MMLMMMAHASASKNFPLQSATNSFLGEWLNEKRKALIGRSDSEEDNESKMRGATSHGWSDSHLEDSELEDPAWSSGVRRPGEEYSSEEAYEDEW